MKTRLLITCIFIISFVSYSQKSKTAIAAFTNSHSLIDFVLLDKSRVLVLSHSEIGYALDLYDGETRVDSRISTVTNLESVEKDCLGEVYTLSADSAVRIDFTPEMQLSSAINRVDYEMLSLCEEIQGKRVFIDHISSRGDANKLGLYRSEGGVLFDSITVHYAWESKKSGAVWNGNTADLTPMKRSSDAGYPGNRYADRNNTYRGGVGAVYDRDSLGRPVYDREPVYQERMQKTRAGQYRGTTYYKSKGSRIRLGDPKFFLQGDRLMVVSPDTKKFASYTMNGELLYNGKLCIPRPFFHSGEIYDELTQTPDGDLFAISTGSAGTQFHLLDVESGKATTLFKLKSWWELVSWEVLDNRLVYMISYNDKVQLHAIDLNRFM